MVAGSNAFRQMAQSMQGAKNLDTVLVGSNYLDAGTHDVIVQAVDSSGIDDNKLNVTYSDGKGKSYTDRMFLMNRDGNEFSFGVRQLWSATLRSAEALAKFFDLAAVDDHAFETLTGMKLRITLRPGPGFTVQATSAGTFAAYEVDDKGNVSPQGIAGTESDQLAESRELAKAQGLKQSYLRIRNAEATNAEENVQAFYAALEAKAKGGVVAQEFSTKVV